MTHVHIHAPDGHYIGQVRRRYARKWETVTVPFDNPRFALATAVEKMGKEHGRARVLFIVESGYYDPNVVMEARWA